MTDGQWEALRPFAEKALAAKQRYADAGHRNARFATERERMDASLAYERLRLEAERAEREYEMQQIVVLGRG